MRAITFSPEICVKRVDDLFGQAVAEIFVLLIAAHVGERQDRDGGLLFGGFATSAASSAVAQLADGSENARAGICAGIA